MGASGGLDLAGKVDEVAREVGLLLPTSSAVKRKGDHKGLYLAAPAWSCLSCRVRKEPSYAESTCPDWHLDPGLFRLHRALGCVHQPLEDKGHL